MKYLLKITPILIFILIFFTHSSLLLADGISNKIEHPYVQTQEKEISLSSFYQNNGDLEHKLSIGKGFSDTWSGELTIAGEKNSTQNFKISSYELEAKWQITEQGEYAIDYGLLFEYETERHADIDEASVALLTEKQWGKWVGAANVIAIYEWGKDIKDEFETALALQAKYRYKPSLEPAIEFYSGEENKGIGPVLLGTKRLAPGKKLNWEIGVILGLDHNSPNQTYRALLEYEF